MQVQIQAFIELISTELQAFSSDEILQMIDPADLAEIKLTDPHPFFKAWVLAHEGTSYPRFVGDTKPTPINWPRRAIQAMKNFIKKGVKFFKGHNRDNSTAGRPYLGKIIATKQLEIDGKLSTAVVGYFPPEHVDVAKNMNVCSMEAVWNLIKTTTGYIANGIKSLTGVALGNGNFEKPAFAGANELAQVQAFEEGGDPGNKNKENKKMEITFNDVENFVKQRNVHPSQLFNWDQIKADRVFLPDINEIETRAETAAADLEKSRAEIEKLQEEKNQSVLSLQKITAKKRLAEIIKDKPDKLKTFILKKADTWEDFSDESMKKKVDSVEADYKEFAAALEDKTSLPEVNPGDKSPEAAASKAENNPALNWDVPGGTK